MKLALGASVAAVGVAILLGAGSLLGGCKEGLGDHCVVDGDCSGGLLCNQATGVCANEVTQDAVPIQDVNLPGDAPPPDAPPDVAGDAPRDAI